MRVLKIANNHGLYIINNEEKSILDINKEDIFSILEVVYANDKVEIDEIDDTHNILNDAEKVIYENIYKYLKDFIDKKEDISKEINDEFLDITKYFEVEEKN